VSEYPFGRSSRRPRGKRGSRLGKALLAVLAVAVVFVLGIALGKALNDGPDKGHTVTYVRTLQPLQQQPAGTP
jgi:hypothetical protein